MVEFYLVSAFAMLLLTAGAAAHARARRRTAACMRKERLF